MSRHLTGQKEVKRKKRTASREDLTLDVKLCGLGVDARNVNRGVLVTAALHGPAASFVFVA